MNAVDALLALLILLSIWNGISQGFFAEIIRLGTWLASILLSLWLSPYLFRFFKQESAEPSGFIGLLFLVCLFVTVAIMTLITRGLLRTMPRSVHEHPLNKLFGVFSGFVVGLVYATIVATAIISLPILEALKKTAKASRLAQSLTTQLRQADLGFTPILGDGAHRSLARLTTSPESNERISLPFTVGNAPPRPDLENEMLQLVNAERATLGLLPLKADTKLQLVAREHSADMFERSYFSHVSPEGLSPFDRIKRSEIPFITAGENLANAPTLLIAHEGLMNSPGHRANILRSTFSRVGIGILDGGRHGLMVTQKFRN